jgi:YVTN family beta-propeller protein
MMVGCPVRECVIRMMVSILNSPQSVGRRIVGIGVAALFVVLAAPVSAIAAKFATPTYSSPITMSADGRLIWVVNPGGDNVVVIGAKSNKVLKRIKVGDEPQGVAVDPNNRYAYVANAAAGTVTVIRIKNPKPSRFNASVARDLGKKGKFVTGAEPWNIVASPDGRRIYVANSSQDSISVIDATRKTKGKKRKKRLVSPRLLGGLALRGSACSRDVNLHFQPRGLAVTKNSKKLFVTSFFSFQRPGFRQVSDEGRQGIVCRININTKSKKGKLGAKAARRIAILPRDTGFAVDKNLDNVADPVLAWPNQMQSIVIRGGQAFVPNIAASPEGPQRFNNSTMAFVNVIDGINGGSQSDGSAGKFLNLHLGARTPEAGKKKLFFANPWAIGFTSQRGSGAAYVVSAGSDLLVKVNVSSNGTLSFTGGPQTTRYIDLNDPANPATGGDNAGKNPQGIVVNKNGTRAWVNNFVSRNVSLVNLQNDTVIRTIRYAALPAPGSQEEVVAVGAEMFFSSRGNFDRPAGTTVSTSERLSSDAWQSCSSCHFKGLTDSVVWAFGTGPRKSLPLNASFNPSNRGQQKILNYSAVNDEIEDFSLNIRNVSGPGALAAPVPCSDPAMGQPATSTFDPNHGLIFGDNGNINLPPCVINAIPAKANADRQQFKVTLPGSNTAVPAQTALREWVRFAIRTPDGPFTNKGLAGRLSPADVRAGQALFAQAGCANCHGGTLFSNSIKDYVSPPAAAEIANERTPLAPGTNPVGAPYVGKFITNIGSFNLGVPGQGNDLGNDIGADEKTTAGFNTATGLTTAPFDALGIDYNGDGKGNGFTIPSLLGIDSAPPYYHNGACETLDCVLSNVKHRTSTPAGGPGSQPDALASARDRARVIAFLRSLH